MSSNDSIEEESVQIVDISEFFSADQAETTDDHEASQQQSTYGEIDSPIKELKAIILSLDWEINDEITDSFISEVDRLSTIWNSDKVVMSFLQILRALGKYLRTHKANAHPDSVNLLYSVYNHFEKIVLTDEITSDQEQAILNDELQKFKNLKKKIAAAAVAAAEGRANDSLLSALKGILLEIDWQITNQTMAKFDLEINSLEQIWRTNKIFLTPLQMMRAIGGYINKNKQDSHPDSIKLLNDVYDNFEKITLSEEMTDEERQEIINTDLERFTLLKKQISTAKSTPAPPTSEDLFADVNHNDEIETTTVTELPGKLIDEEYDTDEIDISTVVPIDCAPVEPVTPLPGSTPETEVTAEEVGSRLDDLFGMDDQDQEVTPLPGEIPPLVIEPKTDELFNQVTPLPETDTLLDLGAKPEIGEENDLQPDSESAQDISPIPDEDPSASTTSHTNNLQRIINQIDQDLQIIDQDIFKTEVEILRDIFPRKSPQETILQVMASVSTYRATLGNNAHPDSAKLLLSLGSDLCQTEKEGMSADDLVGLINSTMGKYTHFQDSVLLPTMLEMQDREKEIKQILGLLD